MAVFQYRCHSFVVVKAVAHPRVVGRKGGQRTQVDSLAVGCSVDLQQQYSKSAVDVWYRGKNVCCPNKYPGTCSHYWSLGLNLSQDLNFLAVIRGIFLSLLTLFFLSPGIPVSSSSSLANGFSQ